MNRFTSQPQFCIDNTPATIEADQILLALQQLASNRNSAVFQKTFNRTSKLPKSLTATMPTFDGKSEKVELFDNLFQTSLKVPNQLTEEYRVNYFHSLMRGDALQTLKKLMAQPKRAWEKFCNFQTETRKTPFDGDNETQISETCLQSSKPEVSRLY